MSQFIHDFATRQLNPGTTDLPLFIAAIQAVALHNMEEVDPFGVEVWECDTDEDGGTGFLVYQTLPPKRLWTVSEGFGDVWEIDPDDGSLVIGRLQPITTRCRLPKQAI